MNGGRRKWEAEGRAMTRETAQTARDRSTPARRPTPELRAFRDDVLKHIGYEGRRAGEGKPLVDVRSPGEYTGELLHMPDYPQEGAHARRPHPRRGEHPLGAGRRPRTARSRPASELKRASTRGKGITADKDVVAYCRIGERSRHTWFVLHELLGYPERAQLRRLLDRMGQHGRRADRAVGGPHPLPSRQRG